MPRENFPTSETVAAVVHHAGENPTDHGFEQPSDKLLKQVKKQLDPSGFKLISLRDLNNPDHIKQDLEDLKSGVLDEGSFVNGYMPQEHPVEYLVHDEDGNLKQRIHSQNLRTNQGGTLQGLTLFSDAPAYYYGLTGANISGTATSVLGTTTVNGSTIVTLTNTGATWPAVQPYTPTASLIGTAANNGSLAGRVVMITGGTGNPASGVYGVILYNTPTILYLDGLHTPGTDALYPAGSITTAPNYTILPVSHPFIYMALSNSSVTAEADDSTNRAPWNALTAVADTSTLGEITTAAWARRLASTTSAANGTSYASPTWQSPAGVAGASPTYGTTPVPNNLPNGTGNSYIATQIGILQLVVKFTGGGGATLGATVNRSALFNTATAATGVPAFQAVLTTPATLGNTDTLTVTWQIQF